MQFKEGQVVQIKPGNTDPDSGLSVAGWSGRIVEILSDEKTLNIELDSLTLLQLPDPYIRQSLDEGYDYFHYHIEMSEVEVIPPRDEPRQTLEVREDLELRYRDYELHGEKTYPYSQIAYGDLDHLDMLPDNEYDWMELLQKKLSMPFAAVVTESSYRIRQGRQMKILDLNDADDMYGIIADCKHEDGSLLNFPLCDLEAIDQESENYKWLRRYVVWFANR